MWLSLYSGCYHTIWFKSRVFCKLGMVAHTCNPIPGRKSQEEQKFKVSLGYTEF